MGHGPGNLQCSDTVDWATGCPGKEAVKCVVVVVVVVVVTMDQKMPPGYKNPQGY